MNYQEKIRARNRIKSNIYSLSLFYNISYEDFFYSIKEVFEKNENDLYEIIKEIIEESEDKLVHYSLHLVYFILKGNNKKVKDYLKRLDGLSLENIFLHKRLGLIYNDLKDYDNAINQFKKIIIINPNDYIDEELIKIYIEAEKFSEAISFYKERVKEIPERGHHYLGKIYHEAKNDEKAIEEYNNSIKINSEERDKYSLSEEFIKRGYKKIAKIYLKQRKYDKAKSKIKKAKQINEQDEEIFAIFGEINYKKNEYSEAIKNYEEAIYLGWKDPKSIIDLINSYFEVEKYEEVERILKEYLNTRKELLKKDKIQLFYFQLIKIYFEIKEYEKIENILYNPDIFPLIRSNSISDNTKYHERLINIYFENKRYEKIEYLLQKATNRGLKTTKYHEKLYDIYIQLKYEYKAKDILLKALKINDNNPKIYYNLSAMNSEILNSGCCLDANDNSQSELYLKKAIDLNPEETISNYKKDIKLNPKEVINYKSLGFIYKKQRKYEEAIYNYNKAIELSPKEAEYYDSLGFIYKKQEKYERAISNYRKAIELSPKEAEYYDSLGFIYEKQEKYEKAIYNYNKALELDSKNSLIKNHLIELYSITEQKAEINRLLKNILGNNYNVVKNLLDEKEREKSEIRQNIMQAVSHTLGNMFSVQKAITKNLVGSSDLEEKVKRLELFQMVTSSVLESIKVAFGGNIENNVELFNNTSSNRISLFSIFYFALSINLDNLLQAGGFWEDIYDDFFKITENNEDYIISKTDNIRNSKKFKILYLSDGDIRKFVKFFNSKEVDILNNKFHIDIDNLSKIYVEKESYSFSIIFTIMQELLKNMLKYGMINDKNDEKIVIKSISNENNFSINFINKIRDKKITKIGTLKGLEMIKLFSKILGGFKNIKNENNDTFNIKIKIKKELFKEE